MSLKDRHAKSENVRRIGAVAVTADSFRGRPAHQGFSEEEFRGVAANRGLAAVQGVPSPFPKIDLPKAACKALTKKGDPCKARPVSGEPFCVGHARATVGD